MSQTSKPRAGIRRAPSREILSGEASDVYFSRAEEILSKENLDPDVVMEVFARREAVLCGIDETKVLLADVLNDNGSAKDAVVEALADGDMISPKEIVLRIRARYRAFGLFETALLGIMAMSTGWATAARECVDAAAPDPVISFGARHVHPEVSDTLDYAAIIGGCVGASTPAGARLAGLSPTGTMPHSLVLIFGDTVKAAEAFDRHMPPEVPRIVLVDTFHDEAEEALRVAHGLDALLLTRSEDGMSLFDAQGHLQVPAQARDVFDVTGAGDTVIATLATMLGCGLSLRQALPIANRAAGIVVGKFGTASVSYEELFP